MYVIIITIILILGALSIFAFRIVRKKFMLIRAEDEMLKGKDREAEKNLLGILEEDSDNVEALKNLVTLYMNANKFASALEYLERVLTKPDVIKRWDQAEILLFAGYNAKQLRKHTAAIKYYLTALGLRPTDGEALKNVAMLYHQVKEYEKADNYFKKCYAMKDKIKFDKDFVKTFGINCFLLMRFQDSRRILETFVQKYPNDIAATAYLGLSLNHIGEKELALGYLKIGAQYPEMRDEALFALANIYLEAEDKEKAYFYFKKVLETKQVSKEVLLDSYYHIGNMLVADNKINEAVVYWDKIYTLNPHYRDVPDKINKYSALTSDERIRRFTLAAKKEILEICKQVMDKLIGTNTITKTETPDETTIDFSVTKQKGAKSMLLCFRFIRDTERVGEIAVKEFYFKMKEENAVRGVIVSVGPLSEQARDFIAMRSIDLIDRAELTGILQGIIANKK